MSWSPNTFSDGNSPKFRLDVWSAFSILGELCNVTRRYQKWWVKYREALPKSPETPGTLLGWWYSSACLVMSKWEKWMTIFPTTIMTSKWRWGLSITERSNWGRLGARCWSLTAKYAGPNSLGFSVGRARWWDDWDGSGKLPRWWFPKIVYFHPDPSIFFNGLKPPPSHIAIQFDVETTIGE